MKVIERGWAQFIDPLFTDAEILEALASSTRYTVSAGRTPQGTLYRVFGYVATDTGARPIIAETINGVERLALLGISYVDEDDRGRTARLLWVMEADEEDFEAYG